MKLLAKLLFAISIGSLSAAFGLSVVEEPVKYLLVTAPLIACFVAVIELLPDKD